MATTVLAAKQAVMDVVRTALTAAGEGDVKVCWGAPWPWAGDFVMVGDVSTTRTRPRMGRLADEEHAVTVVIGVGTEDATQDGQRAVSTRAVALLNLIAAELSAQPQESLTADARAAGITLGQLGDRFDLVETDPDPEAPETRSGRTALVTATVAVTARRV